MRPCVAMWLVLTGCAQQTGSHADDANGGDTPGDVIDAIDAPGDTLDAPIDAAPVKPLVLSFAPAVHYAAPFKPYALRAADLDGDGDIDLVALVEEASTVHVFRNNGAGKLTSVPAPTPYGFPTGDYPTGGAIADMNGDGIPDVVTADYHGNSVSILRGTGTGSAYTLMMRASYPTMQGAETSNLAVGDWNRDGKLDVIATNPQTHSLSLFSGRGDGTLAPGVTMVLANPPGWDPPEPYAIAAGDFDRDGKLDAAIADNRSGKLIVELGRGDGTFTEAPARPTIGGLFPYQLVTADLDRDGVIDLVVANRGSYDVSVLLGRGNGQFHAALVAPTGPNSGPYHLDVADFDRDGIPDVITANSQSGNASVLRGLGNGHLAAPFDAGPCGVNPYGVAAADLDGDGKPDFAVVNASSNDLVVKLSTATPAP